MKTDTLRHNWHLDADGVEVAKGQGEGVPETPNKAQHSPLPWSYSAIGGDNHIMSKPLRASVATVICDADREFIVRAVNHADKLAEALRDVLAEFSESDNDAPYLKVTIKAREALAAYEAVQL